MPLFQACEWRYYPARIRHYANNDWHRGQ